MFFVKRMFSPRMNRGEYFPRRAVTDWESGFTQISFHSAAAQNSLPSSEQ